MSCNFHNLIQPKILQDYFSQMDSQQALHCHDGGSCAGGGRQGNQAQQRNNIYITVPNVCDIKVEELGKAEKYWRCEWNRKDC